MQLEGDDLPVAGDEFSVAIVGARGVARLTWSIDGQVIGQAMVDCPDPPCHERISIPRYAAESTLYITGEDRYGATSLTLKIKDQEEGGGVKIPIR